MLQLIFNLFIDVFNTDQLVEFFFKISISNICLTVTKFGFKDFVFVFSKTEKHRASLDFYDEIKALQ